MKLRVLIVDDAKVLRLMVASILKKVDSVAVIDQATNGLEGLIKVQKHSYDLIITDLNMPNMDGLEFVLQIRKTPLNKFVKICVLSGETDIEKEKEVRKAGASAYFIKPFDPKVLLKAFKKLLH